MEDFEDKFLEHTEDTWYLIRYCILEESVCCCVCRKPYNCLKLDDNKQDEYTPAALEYIPLDMDMYNIRKYLPEHQLNPRVSQTKLPWQRTSKRNLRKLIKDLMENKLDILPKPRSLLFPKLPTKAETVMEMRVDRVVAQERIASRLAVVVPTPVPLSRPTTLDSFKFSSKNLTQHEQIMSFESTSASYAGPSVNDADEPVPGCSYSAPLVPRTQNSRGIKRKLRKSESIFNARKRRERIPPVVRDEGLPTERKVFDCPGCGMEFKTSTKRTEHRNLHHTERGITCLICKRPFAKRTNLKKHLYTQHSYSNKLTRM